MKKLTFEIQGTKSLLYHRFNIECITDTKKIKEGTMGNNPNEWKNSIWNEGRKLYIPGFYFSSMITNGGKFVKIGRGTISKNIASSISICDEVIYITNRELPAELEDLNNANMPKENTHPVYLDIRAVSNPNTKGKNVRYRLAVSPGWELTASILWDESILSLDQIKAAIEYGGKLVGLADGRSMGYGRFEIKSFQVDKY